MRYIGVDLAWGDRSWTGLAELDDTGRLLDLARARSDAEILNWLRARTTSACLVAIDAPVIVTNPSGQRPCEGLIGRYFGSRGVFAHSSNTGNPAFSSGGRAKRLAETLGLDTAMRSDSVRRAVEVYPHPALAALFDLDSVVKYKHKADRDLNLLKSETLRLMGCLDSLTTRDVPLLLAPNPRWQEIQSLVTRASTKADLHRVEDEIDAVICAYVAALADRAPQTLRYIGDPATGFILTPVTPEIAARIDAETRPPLSTAASPTPTASTPDIPAPTLKDRAIARAIAHEITEGRQPQDTRRIVGAAADILSPPRTIEVKACGGTARGDALQLEPHQMAAARSNPAFHVYVVDNLNDPGKTKLHDLHGERLSRPIAAARERHDYEVPWPAADYEGPLGDSPASHGRI